MQNEISPCPTGNQAAPVVFSDPPETRPAEPTMTRRVDPSTLFSAPAVADTTH